MVQLLYQTNVVKSTSDKVQCEPFLGKTYNNMIYWFNKHFHLIQQLNPTLFPILYQ